MRRPGRRGAVPCGQVERAPQGTGCKAGLRDGRAPLSRGDLAWRVRQEDAGVRTPTIPGRLGDCTTKKEIARGGSAISFPLEART